MITINDKKYLNLEETVDWCVDKINDHYNRDRILADFGIKIVGEFDTPEELEGVVGEAYGDAYLIGATEPYSFYVWTRANPPTHEEDYWLDIGPIAIQGPTGPAPDIVKSGTNIVAIDPTTGDENVVVPLTDITGPRGISIRTFVGGSPNQVPGYTDALIGDSAINAYGGDIWRFGNGVWSRVGNLKGPQGVQGPQGIQGPQGPRGEKGEQGLRGDVGGLVNIRGLLDNINQLPNPATLNNFTAAYLVGSNKDLYIQVGDSPETASWTNTGPFNAATLVTVQGVGQNIFDADTKLDKVTTAASIPRAYCVNASGSQTMTTITSGPVSASIAYRNASKSFEVGEEGVDPRGPLYVANKDYVDRQFTVLRRRLDYSNGKVSNDSTYNINVPADFNVRITWVAEDTFTLNINGEVYDNMKYAEFTIFKALGNLNFYILKYATTTNTQMEFKAGTYESATYTAPPDNTKLYEFREFIYD